MSERPKSSYFIRKTTPASSSSAPSDNVPKATSTLFNISGTRTSLQNNQLLTSIGIPSIDYYLGGGLPVGGVCLVGQDTKSTFTDVLKRCFIAEGVFHKHSIYIADLNESSDRLLNRIPAASKIEHEEESKTEERLRIAWRYASQTNQPAKPTFESSTHQPNYFRTDKTMSKDEVLANSAVKFFSPDETATDRCSQLYSQLAKQISAHNDAQNFNVNKTKEYKNILRIVLDSMGGLVWNDDSVLNEQSAMYFCRFLLFIRHLLRHSLAICLITVPHEIAKNTDLWNRFAHLADHSFIFDDSIGSLSSITKSEYDGLFRLNRMPRLNSFNSCHTPDTLDLAFYLKKKRLIVEQLHLPPELGENNDAQKGRTNTSLTVSCGSQNSSNNKLDF